MRDPYEVLGIPRSATPDEVKAAFRRLAQEHHPDKHAGDPAAQERFKEINAAHQILSDPQKRAAWDRFGAAAFGGAGGSGPGAGFPFDFSHVASVDLDGIFGDLLRGFGLRVGERGDLKKDVALTLEEAAAGCEKDVTYDRVDLCDGCRGNGSAPGHAGDPCGVCRGTGRVRFQQAILPVSIERTCSRCRGTGRIVTHPCETCGGAGLVRKERTIAVTLPPGIEDGATRLVERGGNALRPDRAPGDLELTVRVKAHPFFKRAGDDVACTVPITFAQAALGGEVEVPTLEGRGKLRIPPGTQPGAVLRIRGKGMPRRVRGGRGDQLVEATVEVPASLTPRARELVAELAAELREDVQPQQKTFLEKLRELFG